MTSSAVDNTTRRESQSPRYRAALLVAGLCFAATASDPATTPAPTNAASSTTGTEAAASPTPDAPASLTEALAAQPKLKRLVAALKKTGLWETLGEPGPWTVFAPIDAAFLRLPPDDAKTLARSPNRMRRRLAFHIVPGLHPLADLRKAGDARVRTLGGERLGIKIDSGRNVVLWDGTETAGMLGREIPAANGVIFLVDGILRPPQPGM
jgi:uncharacterized surface protein with fasciclin (FAS1) repeats